MRLIAIALFFLSTVTQAETVIYEFEGLIDFLPPNHVANTSIRVGDSWSATVTVDIEDPNVGAGSTYGEAIFRGTTTNLTIGDFGTATFLSSSATFQNDERWEDEEFLNPVSDNHDKILFEGGMGRQAYFAGPEQQIDGLYALDLDLQLVDLSSTLFSTTPVNPGLKGSYDVVLPGFNDLSQFVQGGSFDLKNRISVRLGPNSPGSSTVNLGGTVTSATVSVVPIPAAAWLFGSALAGLGWARRRQTV
jgi:hypothetical protein